MPTVVRSAREADLPRLIELLAQLSLDEPREDFSNPRPAPYDAALAEILADPRQDILVAEADGAVIGMLLFIRIPNLSHVGRPYAMVEDVVVDEPFRGSGHGEALMRQAIEMAREGGCYKLTFTSNKARSEAHRFYRRLGFNATHEGFRMDL